ncbi:PilW family protein [Pseudomonas benzopyrenica]|uniref:PilW family protein n=1 Tax=Pseudomonas benzopyrenica TaxID=2993566 RepID=A0ABZ2FQ03_9PSED
MNSHQRGLSLIELMIALLISSFLILGVTQLYINNKQNYLFHQGQTNNQENARYSLMMFEQQLAKAGFKRRPFVDSTAEFPAKNYTTASCNFAAGQTIYAPTDQSLCIRYKPRDTLERDCLGNGPASTSGLNTPYTESPGEFIERYSLVANDGEDLASLTCTTASSSGALIDGVADLRFDFGFDDQPRTVSTYDSTPAASKQIGAVRYRLLLASKKNLGTGTNAIVADWNERYGSTFTTNDGRIYQVASSTLTLRNLMP